MVDKRQTDSLSALASRAHQRHGLRLSKETVRMLGDRDLLNVVAEKPVYPCSGTVTFDHYWSICATGVGNAISMCASGCNRWLC
jgi:hypothetical protein